MDGIKLGFAQFRSFATNLVLPLVDEVTDFVSAILHFM